MLALLWADAPSGSLTSPLQPPPLLKNPLHGIAGVFWRAGDRNKLVKTFPTGLEKPARLRTCSHPQSNEQRVHLVFHTRFHTRQALSPLHHKDQCFCITTIHFLLPSTPLPRNRGAKWDQVPCNCKKWWKCRIYSTSAPVSPLIHTEEAAKHFPQTCNKLETSCRKDQKPQITT